MDEDEISFEANFQFTPFLMPPGYYVEPINMAQKIMKRVTEGRIKASTFMRIEF